jgi:DNA-binding transcriptional LysR family regulator
MLQISDLEFFSGLAHASSLAAAARELNVTPSAVTQRLQDLERRIGARLIDRRGRRVVLTDEGEVLAARGAEITDAVAALSEAIATGGTAVSGHLRVVAPFGFGRAHVAPVVGAFAARYPDVTVDLQLTDQLGRSPAASWDVAIIIGARRDASMRIQTLAPNQRLICAAPSYVARAGMPETPRQLVEHACIALRENDEDVTLWRFTAANGATSHVRITPTLSSNDGDVVRAWALAGHGIVIRSEWSVADDLRAGRLVRVLPGYTPPDANVLALVSARRAQSKRTTTFLADLAAALAPVPWLAR